MTQKDNLPRIFYIEKERKQEGIWSRGCISKQSTEFQQDILNGQQIKVGSYVF